MSCQSKKHENKFTKGCVWHYILEMLLKNKIKNYFKLIFFFDVFISFWYANIKNKKNIILIYFKIKKHFKKQPHYTPKTYLLYGEQTIISLIKSFIPVIPIPS
jgi:hypothetical protein